MNLEPLRNFLQETEEDIHEYLETFPSILDLSLTDFFTRCRILQVACQEYYRKIFDKIRYTITTKEQQNPHNWSYLGNFGVFETHFRAFLSSPNICKIGDLQDIAKEISNVKKNLNEKIDFNMSLQQFLDSYPDQTKELKELIEMTGFTNNKVKNEHEDSENL